MKKTTDVHRGTLALMVLKTLDVLGPLHGYGLARRIEQISGDRLTLNAGTLYPLLLRLEQEGAIASERGPSENNRSARFYRLTRAGRRQLEAETRAWEQTTAQIDAVLCREGGGPPVRRLRQWLIRLTTSLTRRHDETRLREEIDDHVAFETDANLRRGCRQPRRGAARSSRSDPWRRSGRTIGISRACRRSSICCRTCASRFGGCGRRPASRRRRSPRWRLASD